MLHAYRLIYLNSPHAPPTLWEWKQPWIHHLVVNARSVQTAAVEQRYFRDWNALARENARLWAEHYRSRPLFAHLLTWQEWLSEYRQLIIEVQEMYEENKAQGTWRRPA